MNDLPLTPTRFHLRGRNRHWGYYDATAERIVLAYRDSLSSHLLESRASHIVTLLSDDSCQYQTRESPRIFDALTRPRSVLN